MAELLSKEWPVLGGEYKVYNPQANIAVCTIGNYDQFHSFGELENNIAISGQLVTTQGIERIIINTISNPNIRALLVIGKDINLFHPVMSLKCILENGIDENNKVIGTKASIPTLPDMKPEYVEEFRKQIKDIIFINTTEEEIQAEIKKLSEKQFTPHRLETEINFEEIALKGASEIPCPPETLFADRVEAETISDAWHQVLTHIWHSGKALDSQYGQSKEIVNLIVHIKKPHDEEIKDYHYNKKQLKKYREQFLDGVPPAEGYTYGSRIRSWGHDFPKVEGMSVDQVEQIIKQLRISPQTRRSIIATWIPPLDGEASTDQPCLQTVHFLIRDGKLHLTATFRSHDMFGAAPSNWYGLNAMNKYVAEKLGIESGTITTLSMSGHFYEHDYAHVQKIVEKRSKTMKFVADTTGYFAVGTEDKDIIVQHYDNRGRGLQLFRGKTSIDLITQIVNKGIVSRVDHAADLGKEIARAQFSIEHSIPYSQDEKDSEDRKAINK